MEGKGGKVVVAKVWLVLVSLLMGFGATRLRHHVKVPVLVEVFFFLLPFCLSLPFFPPFFSVGPLY